MSRLWRQVHMRWHGVMHDWLNRNPDDYRVWETDAGTIDSQCNKCRAFFCDLLGGAE